MIFWELWQMKNYTPPKDCIQNICFSRTYRSIFTCLLSAPGASWLWKAKSVTYKSEQVGWESSWRLSQLMLTAHLCSQQARTWAATSGISYMSSSILVSWKYFSVFNHHTLKQSGTRFWETRQYFIFEKKTSLVICYVPLFQMFPNAQQPVWILTKLNC